MNLINSLRLAINFHDNKITLFLVTLMVLFIE